jgi:hypothetical protein
MDFRISFINVTPARETSLLAAYFGRFLNLEVTLQNAGDGHLS